MIKTGTDYDKIRKQILNVRETYYKRPAQYQHEVNNLIELISGEIGLDENAAEPFLPTDAVPEKLVFVRGTQEIDWPTMMDWLLESNKPNAIADLIIGSVIDFEFTIKPPDLLEEDFDLSDVPDAFQPDEEGEA